RRTTIRAHGPAALARRGEAWRKDCLAATSIRCRAARAPRPAAAPGPRAGPARGGVPPPALRYWSKRASRAPPSERPPQPPRDEAALEQRMGRRARDCDERCRVEEEENVEQSANGEHHLEPIGHADEPFRRFVEIHDLD